MKLRAYTPEETDDLINRFNVIAEYAYSINEAAYDILVQKHLNYLKDFKPSLFHWKARDFKYFVSKLNRYDSAKFVDWELKEYEDFFRKSLFQKKGVFLRGVHFHDCFTHYMNKFSNQILTDEEKNILWDAVSVSEFSVFGYKIHEKYRALMKYAHQPFEFDESDIGWLESVEYYYKKAVTWNSN